MADYYPLIARAVAGLEKSTGDGRRTLYERARAALVTQLRGVTPALNESDITRERLALEEAIRKVEAEAVRKARTEPRPEAHPKVRAPDASRWDEAGRMEGQASTPGELTSPAPRKAGPIPPRPEDIIRATALPRPDEATRPPAPPPQQRQPAAARGRAPAPVPASAFGVLDETPYADPAYGEPAADEAPADPASASPGAPAYGRSSRPRPGGERRSPFDSGPKAYNGGMPGTGEDADVMPTLGRLARTAFVPEPAPATDYDRAEPPMLEPQPAAVPDFAPEHMLLEQPFAAEDSRPLPPRRGAPASAADEDLAPRRPPRSYADLIKVGFVIVSLGCLAGVTAWQWQNVVSLYRWLRTPAPEVAIEAPPPSTTRTKIPDRIEPGGQPSQPQTGVAVAPTAAPAAVAQRVILYEEDPANPPGGKSYVGSVIWRTERVAPGPGKPAELAIRADAEIPERKLSIIWSLRRDTEPGLSTSHTIEIMFKLPPDFPSGGIANVPGVMMKQAEQAYGAPLAANSVKVTNAYFLIGLHALPATSKDHNIQMLKERAWLDIPIVYSNGRRAILVFEKGTPGERAFAEAFAAWRQ